MRKDKVVVCGKASEEMVIEAALMCLLWIAVSPLSVPASCVTWQLRRLCEMRVRAVHPLD